MSTYVVVPDRIISRAARRVPVRTNAGETVLASAGKMYLCSQSIKARSSAKPRYSTIGACVCVLIKPGRMTRPRASMVSRARNCAAMSCRRSHADDGRSGNGDGARIEHTSRSIHRDDDAVREARDRLASTAARSRRRSRRGEECNRRSIRASSRNYVESERSSTRPLGQASAFALSSRGRGAPCRPSARARHPAAISVM